MANVRVDYKRSERCFPYRDLDSSNPPMWPQPKLGVGHYSLDIVVIISDGELFS